MANEVTVVLSLNIRKDALQENPQPTSYQFDMSGTVGPTPGVVTVPTTGAAVDLAELTTPGPCWLVNLDPTNYVEYGIRDPGANIFYPLGELQPWDSAGGKPQYVYLSRNLLEEYTGTGTGTTPPGNQLWLKANKASCKVVVKAFDR